MEKVTDLENGRFYRKVLVKDLHKGDFFSRVPVAIDEVVNHRNVLVRGSYDRSLKRYSCTYFDDVNHEAFLKSNKYVYIDFVF